ncbi:hypothetical protein N9L06_01885 [Mariniblastus sp.]|nr:hypothetical protein [Mariniblastus sp.]
MSRILVDTDVLSFYFKRDTRFDRYAPELDGRQLVISFMTLAELQLWQELKEWGKQRRNTISKVLDEQFITIQWIKSSANTGHPCLQKQLGLAEHSNHRMLGSPQQR